MMTAAMRVGQAAMAGEFEPLNLLAYVHLRNIHGSTGAGRVARQMVEHLAVQPGMDLMVLADPADYARIVPQVGEPWNSLPYRFIKRETSLQQAQWYFLGLPNAGSYWPEAQLVYCTAESYVPPGKAQLAVTLHDAAIFEDNAHAPSSGLWKQRLKWNLLYRTLGRRADLFHTVSHFSADRLAYFFPAIESRIRVVHNAVTPRFFEPVSEEGELYLDRQGLRDRPYILLPRGLAHRKNADLVLSAWPILREKHPELKLVVTSHSDEPYASRARALDGVLLTGFVSDEALCSLYAAAQVVWFPSLYEGFGLPVLEAMACGSPVVASDTSSLPEVSGNAAVLVSPHGRAEHIDAIDDLLRDTPLRNSLVEKGRQRADRFTWKAAAAKLRGYFSEIV